MTAPALPDVDTARELLDRLQMPCDIVESSQRCPKAAEWIATLQINCRHQHSPATMKILICDKHLARAQRGRAYANCGGTVTVLHTDPL